MCVFSQIMIKGDLWADEMMGAISPSIFDFLEKTLFFLKTHIHVLNCQSCHTDGTISVVPRRGLVCDLSLSGGSAMQGGAQRGQRATSVEDTLGLCPYDCVPPGETAGFFRS